MLWLMLLMLWLSNLDVLVLNLNAKQLFHSVLFQATLLSIESKD